MKFVDQNEKSGVGAGGVRHANNITPIEFPNVTRVGTIQRLHLALNTPKKV